MLQVGKFSNKICPPVAAWDTTFYLALGAIVSYPGNFEAIVCEGSA